MNTRPIKRSDCAEMPRPCPWNECRYHLPKNSTAESCALDVADSRNANLAEIGSLEGLSAERVRQLERAATANLRERMIALKII
jgi:Sigma-70, region 4